MRELSLVSVVGEALREDVGLCARALATLAEIGARPEIISYGATRNNVSFVVPQARVREILTALHERLFAR